MKRIVLTSAVLAGVIAATAFIAAPSFAHGPGGYGMMGGGHSMMGGGYPMMGGAPGAGFDCHGSQQASLDKELSIEDVKSSFERHLAMRGNPNLKVGEIAEKDENTITAEIVTKDGSLVRGFEIDRKTGQRRPVK